MTERIFTAEEVNAALGWNWSGISVTESEIVAWWESHWLDEPFHIAALHLGVLPEGWERHHASDSIFVLYSKAYDQWVITATAEGSHVAIHSPPWYWPEAVRSGQADIACRLMAAHVELERRRMEKGIVDVR